MHTAHKIPTTTRAAWDSNKQSCMWKKQDQSHIFHYNDPHHFRGTIIGLIRLNEEASKSVTKQSRGLRGVYKPGDWEGAASTAGHDRHVTFTTSHQNLFVSLPKLSVCNYHLLALYYISGSPDKAREAVSPICDIKVELFKSTIITS